MYVYVIVAAVERGGQLLVCFPQKCVYAICGSAVHLSVLWLLREEVSCYDLFFNVHICYSNLHNVHVYMLCVEVKCIFMSLWLLLSERVSCLSVLESAFMPYVEVQCICLCRGC
jgi:hypothetical protein